MEVLNEYRGQIIEAFWITIQLTVLSALGALILGTVTTLGILGWWLAGLPGFEAAPLDFVIAFGMLGLLWLVWKKRQA